MEKNTSVLQFFRKFFFGSIIIGIFLIGITHFVSRITLQQEIINTNEILVNQIANEISRTISNGKELTEKIAYNHELIDILGELENSNNVDTENLNKDINLLTTTIGKIVDHSVLSHTRKNQLYNAQIVNLNGQLYDQAYVVNHQSSGIIDPSVLNSFLNDTSQQLLLDTKKNDSTGGIYRYSFQILQKVRDHISGDLYGVVVLDISENMIYSHFRDLIQKNKNAYVVNEQGYMVSGNNKNNLNRKVNEVKNFSVVNSIDHNELLVINAAIPGTSWELVHKIPKIVALASLQRLSVYSLALLFMFIVVMFMFISRYSNQVTMPILHIKEKMNQAKSGQNHVRIHPDQNESAIEINELSQISTAFNSLMDYLNLSIQSVKENEKQKRLIEQDFLRAQINPHFIYNSLTSIRFFIEMEKVDEAGDMLLYFSKILRKTLSRTDEFVTLKEEIQTLQDYVKLQSFRYPESLELSIDINEYLLNEQVPSFILQPIVENSIFHGKKEGEICHLLIRANCEDEKLYITIKDDGNGMNEEQLENIFQRMDGVNDLSINSIGLRNIHQRLVLVYGDDYGVFVESEENVGTTVTLSMPSNMKG